MPLAGHPVVVYIKATNATPVAGDEVNGINSVGYSPKLDLLDVTDFMDTTGCKLKLGGLKDGSISWSGDYEAADAPQTLLRTAASDGSSVWATLHFNPGGTTGQKGFQVECKSNFEIKADVAGKVETSGTLDFTGAPVAV
jgi:predicted secreted protein